MDNNSTTPGLRHSPGIILPHSGYRRLLPFRKSEIILQGTLVFTRRFLAPYGDRTVDQMVQAARSCKQNIAEGSAASLTSKENELKLTGVARASLDELLEDYHDYLTAHHLVEWPANDPRKTAARIRAREKSEWQDWAQIFETRPAETLANLAIILICQARYLLERLLKRQEADLCLLGDFRERVRAAQNAGRAQTLNQLIFTRLSKAKTPEELAQWAQEIIGETQRTVTSVTRYRGWLTSRK